MKTSELQGIALDWAVTKCEGYDHEITPGSVWGNWGWATDWAQGGPIIDREGIGFEQDGNFWFASYDLSADTAWGTTGPTPLIAAMRCYVASKLGDDIELPKELA